jgi:hypothetical protein
MSSFAERLDFLVTATAETFQELAVHLDSEWFSEALCSAEFVDSRRRRFPAEQVMVLVLAMAIFRDRSIQAVVSHLDLALGDGGAAAPSASVQARYRVGVEPLRQLFCVSAARWSQRSPRRGYAGMQVLAIDGTHMRIPDSDENNEYFGRPGARDNGVGGYPQVRIAAVLDVDTRLVTDAHFVPWDESEAAACAPLWERLPTDALVVLDRGFPSYETMSKHFGEHLRRHALIRLRCNQKFEPIEDLGDGSYLAEWHMPKATKQQCKADEEPIPPPMLVRVIEYETGAKEKARLVTTLYDPALYPATDLVLMYAERWEIEVAYDEVKYHLAPERITLRSLKPDGIFQELWGYMTTYNLIRWEMIRIAVKHDVEPRRVSFQNTFMILQTAWLLMANNADTTGAVATLERMEKNVGLLILPERRKRPYARVVKVKMSNYGKKPVDPKKVARHAEKKEERAVARKQKNEAKTKPTSKANSQ